MEAIVALLLIAAIGLFVFLSYNNLIKLKNQASEAWSDIDVQLKRRYNLIPNLVETVKGYASHEQETLTKVTEARNMAVDAKDVKSQGAAENMLSGALKSLFAVSENYPDLKANQNFIQLQEELVDTEDKIQASRRFYNGVVRDFNTKIQMVPVNIIAGLFGFKEREFFEIEDEKQRENVDVSFKKEEAPVKTETPTPSSEPDNQIKEEVKKEEMPESKSSSDKMESKEQSAESKPEVNTPEETKSPEMTPEDKDGSDEKASEDSNEKANADNNEPTKKESDKSETSPEKDDNSDEEKENNEKKAEEN